MAILNRSDLESSIADINDGGVNTASEVRGVLTNIMDSLAPGGGVISDGNVTGIAVPDGAGAATKMVTFANNDTSEDALYKPDAANHRILVKESALYFVTVRFNGQWAATEDLGFGVYVNGAPNPITPIVIMAAGDGVGDPVPLSNARMGFVINDAMVAAGPEGKAAIEVYKWSESGAFTLIQNDIELALEYNQLSIGTVG